MVKSRITDIIKKTCHFFDQFLYEKLNYNNVLTFFWRKHHVHDYTRAHLLALLCQHPILTGNLAIFVFFSIRYQRVCHSNSLGIMKV